LSANTDAIFADGQKRPCRRSCCCDVLEAQADTRGSTESLPGRHQSHGTNFAKVLDGRKQPIRGLWIRSGRFYARLSVESDNGVKKTHPRRRPDRRGAGGNRPGVCERQNRHPLKISDDVKKTPCRWPARKWNRSGFRQKAAI
jgi:hypothetical protein